MRHNSDSGSEVDIGLLEFQRRPGFEQATLLNLVGEDEAEIQDHRIDEDLDKIDLCWREHNARQEAVYKLAKELGVY